MIDLAKMEMLATMNRQPRNSRALKIEGEEKNVRKDELLFRTKRGLMTAKRCNSSRGLVARKA